MTQDQNLKLIVNMATIVMTIINLTYLLKTLLNHTIEYICAKFHVSDITIMVAFFYMSNEQILNRQPCLIGLTWAAI